MNEKENTILFLNRILNGDMSLPTENELPGKEDSPLISSAKELGIRVIEANRFMKELSSGNLSATAPRENLLLGNSKELQSVLRHLLWVVECVSNGDFSQQVHFLGDFSKYFNLFIEQVELREKEHYELAQLEKKRLEQKNHMLNELLSQQLEHYKSIDHMCKIVRGIKHDIKNHCFALNELLNQGDLQNAKEYLSQVSSQLLTTQGTVFHSGNPVLDALLTDKVNKAKNLGIDVHVQLILGDRQLEVSNLDWCIIMGNTLDNAIEACELLPSEPRQIWIFFQIRKNILNLTIKNTALPPKQREDGLYYTSKSSKEEHGIGLSNVYEAAERYDGVVQTKFEDGYFTIIIMLCGV